MRRIRLGNPLGEDAFQVIVADAEFLAVGDDPLLIVFVDAADPVWIFGDRVVFNPAGRRAGARRSRRCGGLCGVR